MMGRRVKLRRRSIAAALANLPCHPLPETMWSSTKVAQPEHLVSGGKAAVDVYATEGQKRPADAATRRLRA